MSKKRRRKDKIKAKKNLGKNLLSSKKTKISLNYDSSFVLADLKKTFIVTFVVLLVLGIISLLYT